MSRAADSAADSAADRAAYHDAAEADHDTVDREANHDAAEANCAEDHDVMDHDAVDCTADRAADSAASLKDSSPVLRYCLTTDGASQLSMTLRA